MSEPVRHTDPVERVSSGVAGLDVVLRGGFLRNGTYIVMGPPGAGKTILGNQICFHHVASGGRAIYVTLLAESHARMLTHLRSLDFFDPDPIAAALTYVSGYRVLEQEGLSGLLELLRKLIREHKATLIVLDGLVSAEAFAQSELAFKKFIHELNTLVGIVGCTTFLLTNATSRALCPEHTMVDGLVELTDRYIGLRAVRELTVRKFRGSGYLRGRHVFEITDAGVTVYPRLEALLGCPAPVPPARRAFVDMGVAELDEMLGGGLPAGSTTMLLGPSGSGKTVLGLGFLGAGARRGEVGLYFGFFESPPRVVTKGDSLGMDLGRFVQENTLQLAWQPPLEQSTDALAERLLALVKRHDVRRLFIDGFGGFVQAASHPRRVCRLFAALTNELRALDVTTVFSQETSVLFGPGITIPIAQLSAISENIVFVRQVELRSRLRRVISIVKTRESDHQSEIRELSFSGEGVKVLGTLGGDVEAILTGIVHPSQPERQGKPRRAAASPKATPRRRGG